MNTKIKQQVEVLWKVAKETVVRDGGHHPIAFLLGADYSIHAIVAIQCDGGSPVDVLTLLIQQAKPCGFIFISEAWFRSPVADRAGVSKTEGLTLQAVTPEVKAICQINFVRGENNAVELWPDTEVIADDSQPGVELVGRIMALRELLEVRQ